MCCRYCYIGSSPIAGPAPTSCLDSFNPASTACFNFPPAQVGFKRELIKEVRAFVVDAQYFRKEWEAQGPMVPGLDPMEAVDRLRKFQQLFEVGRGVGARRVGRVGAGSGWGEWGGQAGVAAQGGPKRVEAGHEGAGLSTAQNMVLVWRQGMKAATACSVGPRA